MIKRIVRRSIRDFFAYLALAPLALGLCAISQASLATEAEGAPDILLAPGKSVIVIDQVNAGVQHEISAPADEPLNLTQALGGASSAGLGGGRPRGANAAQIGADGKVVLRAIRPASQPGLPTIDGGTVVLSGAGITVYGKVVSGHLRDVVSDMDAGRMPLVRSLVPSEAAGALRLGRDMPTVTLVPVMSVTAPGGMALAGGTPLGVLNQTSQPGTISWSSFNIAAGSNTNFVQPGGAGLAVNRGTGGIGLPAGNLAPNGQVLLIAPLGLPAIAGAGLIVK